MTELKNKVERVTRNAWERFEHAMKGVLLGFVVIWALSTISFIGYFLITDGTVDKTTSYFWAFITLIISSLFLTINNWMKK